MKNTVLAATAVLFLTSSCTQSETKTETIENPDGTVAVKTIETEKVTALDSATVQSTVEKAREKLNVAGEKLDSAASKAGATLNQAGRDVKNATQKSAEKVKKDLNKKENEPSK